MILLLFFIFFVVLESLLLPALMGPKAFLITSLFVLAMVIYGRSIRPRLIQAVIFLFFAEVFSGAKVGSFIIPFIITAGFYIWINRFLDIKTNLRESDTIFSIFSGTLVLALLVYVYSFFFILNKPPYNIVEALAGLKILIQISIFQTLGWSVALAVIFKYVLKAK